jgi:hypothetical protein
VESKQPHKSNSSDVKVVDTDENDSNRRKARNLRLWRINQASLSANEGAAQTAIATVQV